MLANVDYDKWRININRNNPEGTGDKSSFEIGNLHCNFHTFNKLVIKTNSNFARPFLFVTDDGQIGMTYEEMKEVVQDWFKLLDRFHKQEDK